MSGEFETLERAGTHPGLQRALNAHLEYHAARSLRRTLTGRLALVVLAIGILTVGLHFLPTAALLTTVVLVSGMFALASSNERHARRRLAEQMKGPHTP